MGLHVTMEIARLRKAEITNLATVWLLATVDPLMLCQSWGISESLATVVAAIRSLTGVGAKVSSHRRALREPLLANGAAEWLFPTVGAQMSSKVRSLSESLCAYLTLVWFLTRVGPHMSLECWWSSVTLATDLANVVSTFVHGLDPGFQSRGAITLGTHRTGYWCTSGRAAIAVGRDNWLYISRIGRVMKTKACGSWHLKPSDSFTRGIGTRTHTKSRDEIGWRVFAETSVWHCGWCACATPGGRVISTCWLGIQGQECIHGNLLLLRDHRPVEKGAKL